MMKRGIIMALAGTMLAFPALAQDGSETATNRTPANAQAFIRAMPPFVVSAWRRSGHSWTGDMDITQLSAPEACVTVLTVQSASGAQDIRIDWNLVDDVATGGGPKGPAAIVDQRIDYPAVLHMTFRGEEQRDRVRAAMQYLKSACDKAAQLGF